MRRLFKWVGISAGALATAFAGLVLLAVTGIIGPPMPSPEADGGHHSPIGGYLESSDLVLVLDVNSEFKPWLVETDRLYEAMNTLDGEKTRGLLKIE